MTHRTNRGGGQSEVRWPIPPHITELRTQHLHSHVHIFPSFHSHTHIYMYCTCMRTHTHLTYLRSRALQGCASVSQKVM